MSVDAFVPVLGVAAALIALWLVVRFPRATPHSLGPALIHLLIALTVASAATPAASVVVRSAIPNGPYLATFVIVLPSLVYVFVAAAWLIAVVQAALGISRR